jgi:hypothetical protein
MKPRALYRFVAAPRTCYPSGSCLYRWSAPLTSRYALSNRLSGCANKSAALMIWEWLTGKPSPAGEAANSRMRTWSAA